MQKVSSFIAYLIPAQRLLAGSGNWGKNIFILAKELAALTKVADADLH